MLGVTLTSIAHSCLALLSSTFLAHEYLDVVIRSNLIPFDWAPERKIIIKRKNRSARGSIVCRAPERADLPKKNLLINTPKGEEKDRRLLR
jgi:hypothetical protein